VVLTPERNAPLIKIDIAGGSVPVAASRISCVTLRLVTIEREGAENVLEQGCSAMGILSTAIYI
jgi:hypothetical protein